MKTNNIHTILFALTGVLLALPAIQQHTGLFKFKPLQGVTVATERPQLTVKSFMSGEFQAQEENHIFPNI